MRVGSLCGCGAPLLLNQNLSGVTGLCVCVCVCVRARQRRCYQRATAEISYQRELVDGRALKPSLS